jgi:VanZ family protein
MIRPTARQLLGGATLLVLAVILYLGLWPNNVRSLKGLMGLPRGGSYLFVVFPPNEVSWLKEGPGLHFGDYGSIFSTSDFAPNGPTSEGCTIEVWLEPEVTEDFTTTLAFSTKRNPLQFRMRQLEDSLSVARETIGPNGKTHLDKIWVDHVFHEHRKVQITLASDSGGTAVYLNGALRRNYPDFKLKAEDFSGRFVFGNSPLGHETWGGNLRGWAVFEKKIDAQTANSDFESWSSTNALSAERVKQSWATYFFREGSGSVSHGEIAGTPDLYWPARFQTLRPELLKPFWKEYDGNLDYWVDAVLNVMAFVPLGLFLCGYLQSRGDMTRPLLMTVIAGFLVSLTIELGQYYLPLRNSGTTDLITNTTGATVGGLVFGTAHVQRIKRYLEARLGGGSRS